jgi:hypothetical protein
MIRIGFPFWRTFARFGVPLQLRIDVIYDADAAVFVATSNDLVGLVAEAATMDELVKEVHATVDELLTEILHVDHAPQPVTDLRLCPV